MLRRRWQVLHTHRHSFTLYKNGNLESFVFVVYQMLIIVQVLIASSSLAIINFNKHAVSNVVQLNVFDVLQLEFDFFLQELMDPSCIRTHW